MARRIEHYFITRTYCENCDGVGYFSNSITAERRDCVECKGEGYKESRELLYADEAERCISVIDWNAEKIAGRVA